MRYPSSPKAMTRPRSNRLPETLYTPTSETPRISGYKMYTGSLKTCANSGTSGRLRTSSITLPMYMLATRPQKSAGFSGMKSGPGLNPQSTSAASRIAVVPEREHADRNDDEVDDREHLHLPEGKARGGAEKIDPHGGDPQAHERREQRFDDRAAGKQHHQRQAERHQREIFGRAEGEREFGDRRRQHQT